MTDRPLPPLTRAEYLAARGVLASLEAAAESVPPDRRSGEFDETWAALEHLRTTLRAHVEGYEAPGDPSDPRHDAGAS